MSRLAGLAAVLFLGLATAVWTAPQRAAKTHTVTIEGMVFQPARLTVAAGDTVVWVNKDLVPHTATTEGKGFDSQAIAAGSSWKLTAREKGEWSYNCTFHPAMKASLRVQ